MYKLLYEDLPNDWPIKKLNDLGISYPGLKNKTKDDFSPSGNAKFINYKNINKNYFIDVEAFENVQVDSTESQTTVRKGDVFFTGSSETPQETGLSSVLLENLNNNVFLNSFSFGFRFNDIRFTSPHFFGYFFRGPVFRDKIYPLAQGSTRFNLSKNELLKLEVPVPPFKEQQKIATILSSVDEAIDKTEQIIEQTKRVKQGLMQQLLTRGNRKTELKTTPVGEIPKNWEVSSFKTIFDRVTTKNKDKTENVLTISGEKGLVNQLDYFNKKVSSKNLSDYIYLEKGDFAYNKSYSNGYPLGAIKMLENYDCGIVSTLYICFRLKQPYDIDFYKYYFDSSLWNKQVHNIAPEGGRSHGLLNVGVKDFFEIPIPVPPVEEQQLIGRIIKSIEHKLIIERSKNSKLNRIKYGLMQQLLTGKLRVPVDENEVISQ